MKPRPFLALGYLLCTLGWLHLGLLATTPNKDPWHLVLPLVQAGFAALAIVATILLPRVNGLFLHWMSLAGIALASTALTVHAFDAPNGFAYAHAAQTLGLLVATYYTIQWWLSSGGIRFARRFAAAQVLAALGSFTILALNFIGQGHPLQNAQRGFAAGGDALVGIGLALVAWMGGVAALTLKTPEPIIKP